MNLYFIFQVSLKSPTSERTMRHPIFKLHGLQPVELKIGHYFLEVYDSVYSSKIILQVTRPTFIKISEYSVKWIKALPIRCHLICLFCMNFAHHQGHMR